MTNSESRKAWHRIQPASSVRFNRTTHGGARHKTDEAVDTPSYVGDHTKLTAAGERFYFGYCGRYL